ncbi:AfsR/SARP family transcriptional regulator [Nocardia noduli]|uniref:AfsR/SARP family transcriptional regulator n=1 Tax=Nocardia noduli TaxID=2815722 RepID=UPI001C2457F0|nr:AfsR/SARP family transcriptional regulator [Nocardia noduli]
MDSPILFCRVLGPIDVAIEGVSADLGGLRSRRALAALSAADGAAVTDEDLIEQIWEDRRPGNVVQGLRAIIWRLRAALGSEAGSRYLHRGRGGYALAIPEASTDRHQLPTLVTGALHHLARGRPVEAVTDLEAAVALWRGEPWEDLGPMPELTGIRSGLTELHDVAIEELQAARLAVTDPARTAPDTVRAIAALTEAVVHTPYRERRWELLALALYRSGRQAEALSSLRRIRTTLREHVGIEPGPSLRNLEQRILRQDPDLLLPAAARCRC